MENSVPSPDSSRKEPSKIPAVSTESRGSAVGHTVGWLGVLLALGSLVWNFINGERLNSNSYMSDAEAYRPRVVADTDFVAKYKVTLLGESGFWYPYLDVSARVTGHLRVKNTGNVPAHLLASCCWDTCTGTTDLRQRLTNRRFPIKHIASSEFDYGRDELRAGDTTTIQVDYELIHVVGEDAVLHEAGRLYDSYFWIRLHPRAPRLISPAESAKFEWRLDLEGPSDQSTIYPAQSARIVRARLSPARR